MPMPSKRLEFGWFVPTSGDTDDLWSCRSFKSRRRSRCSEHGHQRRPKRQFSNTSLIPVQTACWEAWITSAMLVARHQVDQASWSRRGRSYINPALLAKMISAFDQLSGGRVCINLIAGARATRKAASDGITFAKEQRYELIEQEVTLLKTLWSATGRVDVRRRLPQAPQGALIVPKPLLLQKPWPPFYLGGGFRQAWEISAKHHDVHLFWGDRPRNA